MDKKTHSNFWKYTLVAIFIIFIFILGFKFGFNYGYSTGQDEFITYETCMYKESLCNLNGTRYEGSIERISEQRDFHRQVMEDKWCKQCAVQ